MNDFIENAPFLREIWGEVPGWRDSMASDTPALLEWVNSIAVSADEPTARSLVVKIRETSSMVEKLRDEFISSEQTRIIQKAYSV